MRVRHERRCQAVATNDLADKKGMMVLPTGRVPCNPFDEQCGVTHVGRKWDIDTHKFFVIH